MILGRPHTPQCAGWRYRQFLVHLKGHFLISHNLTTQFIARQLESKGFFRSRVAGELAWPRGVSGVRGNWVLQLDV